jgi:hypothetical protein
VEEIAIFTLVEKKRGSDLRLVRAGKNWCCEKLWKRRNSRNRSMRGKWDGFKQKIKPKKMCPCFYEAELKNSCCVCGKKKETHCCLSSNSISFIWFLVYAKHTPKPI